jgi:hypothetical protein
MGAFAGTPAAGSVRQRRDVYPPMSDMLRSGDQVFTPWRNQPRPGRPDLVIVNVIRRVNQGHGRPRRDIRR